MRCWTKILQCSVLVRAIITPAPADLMIYGPSLAHPLFDNLAAAFSYSHTTIVEYQSVSTQDIPALLNSNQAVVLDSMTGFNLPNNSLVFPLYGFPFVITYNLDTIETLYLSQQVLADIFLGHITRWNDTNITALNPQIILPDQPILRIVGSSLSTFFAEGLSVMLNEQINASMLLLEDSIIVNKDETSLVKVTPFSIGFSYMADSVDNRAKIALLENRDGYYVSAATGMPYALSEYEATLSTANDTTTVSPHNMHGRLSWPLVGILYLILPNHVDTCSKQQVIDEFVSLVMFEEEADRLAQVFGWEPLDLSFSFIDYSLGFVRAKYDYKDHLRQITCNEVEISELVHTIGTTSELWSFVLRILVAYSEINPFLVLFAPSSLSNNSNSNNNNAVTTYNISTLLVAMVEGEEKSDLDIDITMTWDSVLFPYPQLSTIPVFMGAITPLVNLGPFSNDSSLVLSAEVLVGIFSGKILFWNDTHIQVLNPGRLLPKEKIVVFTSPGGQPDGATELFGLWLRNYSSSSTFTFIDWNQVNATVVSEIDILDNVQFTPYAIGYSLAHSLQDADVDVPMLIRGSSDISGSNQALSLSANTLRPCWISLSHPGCWPLAVRLSFAFRDPNLQPDLTCKHQKLAIDFIAWVIEKDLVLDDLLIPNTLMNESLGESAYCHGRSLLISVPEPQLLSEQGTATVYVLCVIGMLAAVAQAIALALARNHHDLKSASVIFSFLAVAGCFLILVAPLLIAQNNITRAKCSASIWFLTFGFSLVYGSLFAKLFRLYRIFRSRSLVVPRLSNRKLFYIVLVFLCVDFILLLIYNIISTPQPDNFSLFLPSEEDLVTGKRELVWEMCAFHPDSAIVVILLVYKLLIALSGASMAFFIRQVDRRFTATSALGGAFYNMFFTVIIAILLSVFFKSDTDLTPSLFIPIFCGIWIIYITMMALTLDSNVLLACKDLSQPLRRMLNPKDSKEKARTGSVSKKPSNNNNDNDSSDAHRSHSSTVFVVNRDMFPSKYQDFDPDLLNKILEELNHQRSLVRKALVSANVTVPSSPAIELSDFGERKSRKSDISKVRSQSKSANVPLTEDNAAKSSMTMTESKMAPVIVVDNSTPEPSCGDVPYQDSPLAISRSSSEPLSRLVVPPSPTFKILVNAPSSEQKSQE